MKHVPTRSCIVCRTKRDKHDLLRVVKTSDDMLVIDSTGRADGRGAYVCNNGECIKTAIAKRVFNRAYKQQLPQNAYDSLSAAYDKLLNDGK